MSGRCIQLIVHRKNGKIALDQRALQRVLLHPNAQGRRISILTVAGALRKGKSFLVNFLLRYLKNKGYKNSNWIGGPDTKLDDGFNWRGGAERHTRGINIWSEPFILQKGGHEVAVFIIDTQGSHDLLAGKEECMKVFAISLLLSSVLVFNVHHQIQADDMDYLDFCVKYSKAAASHRVSGQGPSSVEFLLQKLVFLVRDWSYSDFEFGAEGGRRCLNKMIFASNPNDTRSEEKEYLKSVTDKIECYLMPHPGPKVLAKRNPNFQGCIKDLDEDFIVHISDFAFRLLHPENLVVKDNCSNQSLLDLIVRFCDTMESDQALPSPKSFLESVAAAHSTDAFIQAINMYDDEVDKILSEQYVPWSVFDRLENNARTSAISRCHNLIKFGGQEEKKRIMERLENLLEAVHRRAKNTNKMFERMASKSVEELIAGYVSDYTRHMKKFGEASDLKEMGPSLVREHHQLKREMGVSFKRDVQKIFKDDGEVEMERFNEEINHAFAPIELDFRHRLVQIECKLYKLVKDSVHFYEIEFSETRHEDTQQLTREFYNGKIPPEAPQSMIRSTEVLLTNLLNKKSDKRYRELEKVNAKIDVLRAKEYGEEWVLGVVKETENKCADELLQKRLEQIEVNILDEFRAVQAIHESVEGASGFEQSLKMFIDKGFQYARERNAKYLKSLNSTLEIDSLIAQVEHSKALQTTLMGVYMLPEDLAKFHSEAMKNILPRWIPDISESVLLNHNQNVSTMLSEAFAHFKEWNEKNSNIFTKIIGAVKGNIGTAASAGSAAMKLAALSVVPALPVAGSVVLGSVAVLAVGAAIAYVHKRQTMKKYFTEQRENLQNCLQNMRLVNSDH